MQESEQRATEENGEQELCAPQEENAGTASGSEPSKFSVKYQGNGTILGALECLYRM